jgi:peptidoglycan hydrolase CwlO-like protein
MKRYVAAAVVAVIVSTGLVGCGAKEREELKAKVATMEQEATQLKNDSASKDATIADLRSQLEAANNNARAAQDKVAALEGEMAKMKEAATKKPAAKKK